VATSTPALSVILVTRHPWPGVRGALDALHAQAAAVDAEVIVGVSDPAAIPVEAAQKYPEVVWVEERGASVFRLRAAALKCCRAEIVALTEDHAWVAPDWCQQILAAHARYPAAAAIGGVVENGATRFVRDWAGFFVSGGAFAIPIQNGAASTISQQANVSYKRRMFPTDLPRLGLMVHTLHEELRRRGATLVADDRLIVHHVQELSPWQSTRPATFTTGARSRASAPLACIPECARRAWSVVRRCRR
jgi:Glycosyl transferase family 2